MDKVKLILASNQGFWGEGLLSLIKERSQDIEVLTLCHNAAETIDKITYLHPDIVLLDEEIEGGDYGELTEHINEIYPEIKVIIVIKPHKDISLSTSFKARARAYIDKEITYAEIESCIRHVAGGGVVIISTLLAQQIIENIADGNGNKIKAQDGFGLSQREREVLLVLTQKGTTNRDIAKALCITENTVKAHLSSIMEKMQVRNRQQAAILALEKGIITDSYVQITR